MPLSCARDDDRRGNVPAPTSPSAERVTREELTTFLDWQVEMQGLMRKAQEEAKAVVERTVDIDARMEVMRRNQALAQPLLALEPFKDSRKGSAMRAVTEAFYISGAFFRDEKELARLRASYGKELIDSIADQEALFREKVK